MVANKLKFALLAIVALALGAGIFACSSRPPGTSTPAVAVIEPKDIKFETIVKDVVGGPLQADQRVVTSPKDWETLWKEYRRLVIFRRGKDKPMPVAEADKESAPPNVNFDKQVVVAVALGPGKSIEITRIEQTSAGVKVHYKERHADPKPAAEPDKARADVEKLSDADKATIAAGDAGKPLTAEEQKFYNKYTIDQALKGAKLTPAQQVYFAQWTQGTMVAGNNGVPLTPQQEQYFKQQAILLGNAGQPLSLAQQVHYNNYTIDQGLKGAKLTPAQQKLYDDWRENAIRAGNAGLPLTTQQELL